MPNSLSIIDTTNTIDTGYLAQGSTLFIGPVSDNTITAAEFTAIDTWVQAGGLLISLADGSIFDPVSSGYGLSVIDAGVENWAVTDTQNPIIDGPFGQVGPLGGAIETFGSAGYFDPLSLAPGDVVIAENSVLNTPTLVMRAHGAGHILFSLSLIHI